MSSASARAEARRKAILSRGNDRLAKLTTTARGEGAPAFMNDPAPKTSLNTFLGEDSDMPIQPTRASPALDQHGPVMPVFDPTVMPDPSVWSQEQQAQFMQALISGMGPQDDPPLPTLEGNPLAESLPHIDPFGANNPLAALLSQTNSDAIPPPSPKPRTLIQKLMPLVHMFSIWGLLVYFAFFREPQMYSKFNGNAPTIQDTARRWSDLLVRKPEDSFIDIIPFFWAFVTLQLLLHSFRIFSGYDPVQLPSMLIMVLPYLPAPFPTIITTGARYLQMITIFMNDIAALVFGIGMIVWISSIIVD